MSEKKDQKFSPAALLEEIQKAQIDPGALEKIDERDISKAPNFLDWVVGPTFLNAQILPKQLEIGTKLMMDYCPSCSKPGYIDTLFDQTIGNIRDNLVFLQHGRCPKCSDTRFDLWKKGLLPYYNELVAAMGQRCIPKNSWVQTGRGLVEMDNVRVGDQLSFGPAIEKHDSGTLPSLVVTTKMNYSFVGARGSHIVPALRKGYKIENVPIDELKIGDCVFLSSPQMWPSEAFKLPHYEREDLHCGHTAKKCTFPKEVTPELARLVGYTISTGHLSSFDLRIVSSDPDVDQDIKRCCLAVFGEEPGLEEERACEDGVNYREWGINGLAAMEWLNEIGLKPVTRKDKEIPRFILESPKHVVAEFLAGLYGGGGKIYKEADQSSIGLQYTTVSKKLARQLRTILLNYGIYTGCEKANGFSEPNVQWFEGDPEASLSYFIRTKDADSVFIFAQNVKMAEKRKSKSLAGAHSTGCTLYYIPGVKAFEKRSLHARRKTCRPDPVVADWIEQGLRPVPITRVEAGPDLEMADVSVPDTNVYTADGFVHHNSGKTKLVGLLTTYLNHRFLKLANPLRHYRQPAGDLLMGTFSALTAEQAEHTLWEAFKGFIDASPWYRDYHNFLKAESKRIGSELLLDRRSFLQYPHKQLYWHFTGSEDRKMRGKTRIFGCPDEIGWMNSDESKSNNQIMNADAVYTALSNSLATMRRKWMQIWSPENFDSPPILMASISSPSAGKDKIMRLLKDAHRNPRIYAVKLPSWLANPDYSYEGLRTEFSHLDDKTFDRDFGAEPPIAANPFLTDPQIIDRIAQEVPFSGVAIQKIREADSFGGTFLSAKAVPIAPERMVPRVLTFDLGYRKNALACCMFSLSAESKPKLDMAFVLTPENKASINLPHFFDNFTMPLVQNFNIRYAFFDRWQSLDQVQRLRDHRIDARVHSLTYKSIDSVRGAILSQGVGIPKLGKTMQEYVSVYVEKDLYALSEEPLAYLGMQMLTVRDTGFTFAKPLEGDDDLFRAFALGVDRLMDPAIRKTLANSPRTVAGGQSVAPLGAVYSKREKGIGGITSFDGDSSTPLGIIRSRK